MVEIPISIEVERRDDSSTETPADKKRKQNRQKFVTIQSIDETAMSTDDGGLPQIPSSKVGYYKYQIINAFLKHSLYYQLHLNSDFLYYHYNI